MELVRVFRTRDNTPLTIAPHFADTSRARQAFNDAEHSLNLAKQEKEKAEKDLRHIFDPEWFGREGEWKKLDGTCIEKDTGE